MFSHVFTDISGYICRYVMFLDCFMLILTLNIRLLLPLSYTVTEVFLVLVFLQHLTICSINIVASYLPFIPLYDDENIFNY